MSHQMVIYFIAFLVTSHICTVSGLSCYHCSVPRPEEGINQDMTCFNNPAAIKDSVKTCPPHQKACKIKRIDQSGKIFSFVRGCSSVRRDSTEEKPPFTIYEKFCMRNQCNNGNGIESDKKGGNRRITAILIEEEKAGEHCNAPQLSFLAICLFASIMFSL